MNRTKLIPIAVSLCACVTSLGEPRTKTIDEQAKKMSKAGQRGDYETLVGLTYPALVQQFGDRAKMIEVMKTAAQETAPSGVKMVGAKVGSATKPIPSQGKLFSIVPTVNGMTAPNARITQKFLLAISSDNGRTWSFIEGSGISPGLLSKVLPDFPSEMRLPVVEKPIIRQAR